MTTTPEARDRAGQGSAGPAAPATALSSSRTPWTVPAREPDHDTPTWPRPPGFLYTPALPPRPISGASSTACASTSLTVATDRLALPPLGPIRSIVKASCRDVITFIILDPLDFFVRWPRWCATAALGRFLFSVFWMRKAGKWHSLDIRHIDQIKR